MRISTLVALLAIGVNAPLAAASGPELKYVVIVSRHGVRAPTWDAERLNQYSAGPWPVWGVAPGELTPHGRALIKLMGAYYRDWLSGERLLTGEGCQDARRIYIQADKDQRTLETARAFAESLAPGCGLGIHSASDGASGPIFSGDTRPDPERALEAVRERLGPDPNKLLADHRAAVEALQFILTGGKSAQKKLIEPPGEVSAALRGRSVELKGPFALGSTFSENLLLEYTNGMRGGDLGWGRLTRQNLLQVLELHAVYADLMRRTPYLARARGSNLLAHILRSMEQAATGHRVEGALGNPGDAVLLLSGHDTNLSNISGMLGLSWSLPGYQPDDTPPGGALVFSLWRDSESRGYFVEIRYAAQTLDQMRNATELTMLAPPASQDVPLPGCDETARRPGCPWPRFRIAVQNAINPGRPVTLESQPAMTQVH